MLYQELINEYQCVEGMHLGIDKVVIGIPYPKFKLSSDITDKKIIDKQIMKVDNQKKIYKNNMFYIEKTIKNLTEHKINTFKNNSRRLSILSDEEKKLICTVTLGSTYGTHYINVGFNPSKLTQDDWCELQGLFSVLFMNQYEELYEKGVVSHFEFCLDIANIHLAELVLIDTGRRKTNSCKGTTYHGARKSNLVCTMYDKGAQLKMGSELTRVEARINRRDIKFMDLVEKGISNPFNSFFVVPADALQLIAQEKKMPQLANMIKEFGVYGATQGNPPARKKLLEQLKKYTVPWWKPESFWEAHQKMLLEFKPVLLGGNAYGDKESILTTTMH